MRLFIVPLSFWGNEVSLEQSKNAQEIAKTAVPFAEVFSTAMQNLKETQAVSEKDAYDLAMGNVEDLHRIMINSEKAATALELTVQLTTRAVNAYKEIAQMQI